MSRINLRDLLKRMAGPSRTEATLQSEIHTLLLAADLNLEEAALDDVTLESQTAGRRIDVEVGHVCIEVKKTLGQGTALDRHVAQLEAYVNERTESLGQRYTGVLTDGALWQLYHLAPSGLELAAAYTVNPSNPDVDGFVAWLAGVLATEERVAPTPNAIVGRLGTDSSGHQLEQADLRALYAAHRDLPEVTVKRELWAKLLTTALGTQFHSDDHELFVEHTLLVASAECIAHAVMGYRITELSAAALLGGGRFTRDAQILGVVEHDFFDWPLDCGDAGARWVAGLARRLAQFDWSAVAHDAMKTIYESVIPAETRKNLGEYYTPDFLAEHMVDTIVTDPLGMRVLDPSCGSGTFLFHAVRRYLEAADAAGHTNADALAGVAEHVLGMDLHPVAATLARVTYLLGIGPDRLQGDRGPLRVPVYLGDSIQWGQRQDLFSSETLNVDTDDGLQLFADQLQFPQSLLDDADQFDQLVSEMADAAASRRPRSPHPAIAPIARRHGLSGVDLDTITKTFKTMCELHDAGRDHIWGYFVRNLARPAWLAREANRVDVLIGNPPWLAYRFMTAAMQNRFKDLSTIRGLWAGGSHATQQDLSDLFIGRAVEQYLRVDGLFAFVMPAAVLTRGQFSGFRSASWPVSNLENVSVAFTDAWDLSAVTPYFFPRTSAVVTGQRVEFRGDAGPLSGDVEAWSGLVKDVHASWSTVEGWIERKRGKVAAKGSASNGGSPYRERFANGATIFPRVLTTVTESPAPLGTGAGRLAVRSLRGIYEKKPWKGLPDLEGVVEDIFVHNLILGEHALPFRLLPPAQTVLPITPDGKTVDPEAQPGLADWWGRAEALWAQHRSSNMTLRDNVDYRRKLSHQFPLPPHRVVVAHSAMHVTACRVTVGDAVVEHQLDWCAARDEAEARYLVAVLNSPVITLAATPYMTSGKGGGRHIGKSLWNIPIPLFDPDDPLHAELAALGAAAEEAVADIELPGATHGGWRRVLRGVLTTSGLGAPIDDLVSHLLKLAADTTGMDG